MWKKGTQAKITKKNTHKKKQQKRTDHVKICFKVVENQKIYKGGPKIKKGDTKNEDIKYKRTEMNY